jgi:transcriptional regulator with XRE-family HTH domain
VVNKGLKMTEEVTNKLREFRLRRGLSTTELSRQTNGEFSTSRISNYETGVRALTVNGAKNLSPYLGATPAQLLGLNEHFFTDVKLGVHQEELLILLNKLSLQGDTEVKRVIAMLRAYLDN